MSMYRRSLLAVFLVALFAACVPLPGVGGNAVQGSGKYATREYQMEGFTGITSCCGFRVTVTGGETFHVSVTSDDNLLDVVSVTKEGDTLRIGFDQTKSLSIRSTKLEAAVVMPALQAVSADGGSSLSIAQPAPKAVNLAVSANGGSWVDLGPMPAQNASVNLNGGAHATVNVTGSLDYDLNGGAQLRYTGKPTIGRRSIDGGASASQY